MNAALNHPASLEARRVKGCKAARRLQRGSCLYLSQQDPTEQSALLQPRRRTNLTFCRVEFLFFSRRKRQGPRPPLFGLAPPKRIAITKLAPSRIASAALPRDQLHAFTFFSRVARERTQRCFRHFYYLNRYLAIRRRITRPLGRPSVGFPLSSESGSFAFRRLLKLEFLPHRSP